MWLQKKYGKGYLVTATTDNKMQVKESVTALSAQIVSLDTKKTEISFRVPYGIVESHLDKVLTLLESKEMNIQNYGIRDTNLDEIFVDLAEESSNGTPLPERKNSNKVHPEETVTIPHERNDMNHLTGRKLYIQQFFAIIQKRFIHTKRTPLAFFSSIIIPPLFIGLTLAFTMIVPDFQTSPSLDLQPMMFEDTSDARVSGMTTFVSKDSDDAETQGWVRTV
jgi:hypothetical protein